MSDTGSPSRKERPLPAAWTNNPFEAPTAHVEDARTTIDDTLAVDPNGVGAGRGAAWWSEGWHLFREATGIWIGISIVLVIINIVVGLVPVVGDLATSFLFPVFGAGLMLGCHSVESGEELTFGHLFAGFQNNLGRLLMVGVLYLVGIAVIIAIAAALGFGGGFAAAAAGSRNTAALSGLLLGSLVALALGIPLVMSVWFSPGLVVLHDLTAFEAMKLSFRGCLRNILPFLIYGLLFVVLAALASLPLFLGWLALMPVMFCSTYASYRDIFTNGR